MGEDLANQFMIDCWAIVRARGKEDTFAAAMASISWGFKPESALVFKDETIEIVAEKDPSKRIIITKLDNHNPVVCTDDAGHTYRWHGEYHRLTAHARQLAAACEEV